MEVTPRRKTAYPSLFIFLLPVFFVLHGFTENYDFVPVTDALVLVAVYTGASLIVLMLSWLIIRNLKRASLFTLIIMSFDFFFGSVQDKLKNLFPGIFLTKYVFIIPAALLFFIALFVVLRKTKRLFHRTARYLNLLLLILIFTDVVWLVSKLTSRKQNPHTSGASYNFQRCDTCTKPDIYLILVDEYAGNTELKDLFKFDNSVFEDQLRQQGFHIIPDSHSNYNYTPFSMASLLKMDFLQLKGTNRSENLSYCYQTIRNSEALRFLQIMDYTFYNYSVFDFEGQPSRTTETFLPLKTKLITAQTFLSRAYGDLWFHTIVGKFRSEAAARKFTYYNLRNNEHLYELTWDIATQKKTKPKFVYTHLMMPHYPYYFDKAGNPLAYEKLLEGYQVHTAEYVGYLQYANKKIMALVDWILKSSPSPPIIILLGDHGFRHFVKPVENKYYFINLNAVYLPGKNYALFYDSLSNVNEFRTIFNSQFNQKLTLLKDSTTYLPD